MQIDLIELISQASVFIGRTADCRNFEPDIFIWYGEKAEDEPHLELNYKEGFYYIGHPDIKTSYALGHLLSEQDELKNYQEITK